MERRRRFEEAFEKGCNYFYWDRAAPLKWAGPPRISAVRETRCSVIVVRFSRLRCFWKFP
jgi:hypothetical protein